MKDNKMRLSVVMLILALAGGLYYFLRDEAPEEKKQQAESTRMAFSGSSLVEESDGKRIWELTARKIEVDSKTRWVYLTDLQGVFYRTDGSKIDVTAKEAIVDPKAKNMEMTGGFFMKSSDGPTFRADQGRYNSKDKRIFASGNIHATREDAVLTGAEFEADDKFEVMLIKGNAKIVKGGVTQ